MSKTPRPPVVAILGHVDHGKTTLLDYIRHAHVAAGEAGGITQHIGAYQAEYNGNIITFLDTPGHAAFSKMRSRGAQATDISILVVAADDGVMPQTLESLKYIRNAGVPMIVAINKIDAPDASAEKVKAQLTEHEVYVTGYGGDTEVVEISAKEGWGVEDLLETIVTMGEILEVSADPKAPCKGVVIESSKDKFLGSIATLLIQEGTLHNRDSLFNEAGEIGSVRTLTDAFGKQQKEAGPATPIEVTGFNEVPAVGSIVTTSMQEAVATVEGAATLDFDALLSDDTQKLRLIIKADVAGSLEAIEQNLDSDKFEIISSGVGEVNESDVQMAETSSAEIVAFQTKIKGSVKKLAERSGIRVRLYKIIYELFEALEKRYTNLTEPEYQDTVNGQAELKQVFQMRGETILGCGVTEGALRQGEMAKIVRDEETLVEGTITSMKQGKVPADVTEAGSDCGLVLKTDQALPELVPGDIIIAFERKLKDD